MSRRFPRTFLLVPLLAVAMGATPEASPEKTPPFVIGEKLVYEARIWKGIRLLGFSVGQSTLEVRASADLEAREGIFDAAVKEGFKLIGMSARDASLEEIFVQITTDETSKPEDQEAPASEPDVTAGAEGGEK